MTTSIDTIVDIEATLDEAPALGERIVAVLLAQEVISPVREVHEYLGTGAEYAAGARVRFAVDAINDCFGSGMNIQIGRSLYWPGELGLESITCPRCNHFHEPNDVDWASAAIAWSNQEGSDLLTCLRCAREVSISSWRFEPAWGFGNLAFEFKEWFLKEEFVKQIGDALGHEVVMVSSQW